MPLLNYLKNFNRSITDLNLKGNDIGDEGCKAIAEALMVLLICILVFCCVSPTSFIVTYLMLEARYICNLQARQCEIHRLDLSNNSISRSGAEVLARMIYSKNKLKELNLYMNDIGDGGMKKVNFRKIILAIRILCHCWQGLLHSVILNSVEVKCHSTAVLFFFAIVLLSSAMMFFDGPVRV